MRNYSSSSVRPRPLTAILLVLLLLLLAVTCLITAGNAGPGSTAKAATDVVKLYWGSDTNPNPGNFVEGFTRKENQGKIDETTMTNWGESASADQYGRHMRASAKYGFGGDIIPGDGEYTWVTNAKVNLTDFTQLKIMWRQTWDDDGIWRLVVSNVKDSSYTDDNVRAISHDSKVGPYAVETMDVSDLNGEYYIRVHSRRNSWSLGAASTVRVYKMWLEPPVCYQVNTSSSPTVGGSTANDIYYPSGASGTVTATPAANYEFVNWTEGGSEVSTNASYTFTPTSNRNLVANFRLIQRKIYWNGTEYFPIIGGFEDPVVTQREKRSDNLWMYCQMPALRVQTSWTTGQPVDLTGINNIVVEWENAGSYSDFNESYLIAATNSTDRAEDQALKFKRTLTFGRMIDRLDVSGINEPRYIRVHARDGSNEDIIPPGISSELKVYRIWLESIRSVTPGSAVENTVVDPLVIVGSGFQSGATVKIEKTGTTKLATNVVVESASRITCRLDLSGAPLGTYDVIVTNPGGSTSSMIAGFKVTNVCGGGAAIGLSLFGLLMGFLTVTETVRSRRRRRKA